MLLPRRPAHGDIVWPDSWAITEQRRTQTSICGREATSMIPNWWGLFEGYHAPKGPNCPEREYK